MDNIIEDFKNENFTAKECVIYGVFAPVALFAACIISNIIIG